jgi:hypothetical protein
MRRAEPGIPLGDPLLLGVLAPTGTEWRRVHDDAEDPLRWAVGRLLANEDISPTSPPLRT